MKIEGGPPSQPSQVDTTQGSEAVKQTEPKGPPPPPPAPDNTSKSTSHSYNTGAQVAEHSIAGQAKAAQLKSQANSAAAGGVAGLIGKASGALADAVGKAVTVLTEPPKPHKRTSTNGDKRMVIRQSRKMATLGQKWKPPFMNFKRQMDSRKTTSLARTLATGWLWKMIPTSKHSMMIQKSRCGIR